MIAIGRIVKSVGIRGEVKVLMMANSTRLRDVKSAKVGKSEVEGEERSVELVRVTGDEAVVRLSGIASRNDADAVRGMLLFINEEGSVRPAKGEYFIHDVVGMGVVSEDGNKIGRVTDVLQMPGGDRWIIDVEGREVMVPAVKEFIRSVDVRQRQIVLRVIEGLLD